MPDEKKLEQFVKCWLHTFTGEKDPDGQPWDKVLLHPTLVDPDPQWIIQPKKLKIPANWDIVRFGSDRVYLVDGEGRECPIAMLGKQRKSLQVTTPEGPKWLSLKDAEVTVH